MDRKSAISESPAPEGPAKAGRHPPARTVTKACGSAPCRHSPVVGFRDKILSLNQLSEWRDDLRRRGKRLVVTNGCFDLLHLGHASYLEAARALGDTLLVGVNSDASVRLLKGPDRPVHRENDRAALVAALGSVDVVCLFDETSAASFLARARPDVWAKGADYTLETLNQEERRVVESAGGTIAFITLVPGRSTTATLREIGRLGISKDPADGREFGADVTP